MSKSTAAVIIAIATFLGTVFTTLIQTFVVPHPEPEAKQASAETRAFYELYKKTAEDERRMNAETREDLARLRGWLEACPWQAEIERRIRESTRTRRWLREPEASAAERPAPPPPEVKSSAKPLKLPDFKSVQQEARF